MVEGPRFTENLKLKHLAEGIKSIMVCIGSFEDFGFKKPDEGTEILQPEEVKRNLGLDNLKNVDQKHGTYGGEKTNETLTTKEPATYVFSPIDSNNKFSENLRRCTVLVVTGVDKITGENISFVSHQDPAEFLYLHKSTFTTHLKQRLDEIKERCKEKTIDAIILGGRYFTEEELDSHQIEQFYNDSIKLVGGVVEGVLDFKPVVVNGPKHSRKKESIYYDNTNRRLYFLRPETNPDIGNFVYSDVDKHFT